MRSLYYHYGYFILHFYLVGTMALWQWRLWILRMTGRQLGYTPPIASCYRAEKFQLLS